DLEHPLAQGYGDGQALGGTERFHRLEPDPVGRQLLETRRRAGRALRAGKGVQVDDLGAFRQGHVGGSRLYGELPEIAGDVPVELVMRVEQPGRPAHTIADLV